MNTLLSRIQIRVNDGIYLKDPESSELGRSIITGGIDLIDEIGFEAFTFKKLAVQIGSTEASVYRYFVSKHHLLMYLIAWYWSWMEYRLVFMTANIPDPREKLTKAIRLLTEQVENSEQFEHIDEGKLRGIVIMESSKAYLTKEVDKENKAGFFLGYKYLVARVCEIIEEIDPNYPYPHMLISTVIEGANHQRFFADHLPRLTDQHKGEDSVTKFYVNIVLKEIGN